MAMECENKRQRIDKQEQNCCMTFYTKALEIFKAKDLGEFITNHFFRSEK